MPPKDVPGLKPGTVAITFDPKEGDPFNDDVANKVKVPHFKFDEWLEDHLVIDRPLLKIPTLKAKDYALKARLMYEALILEGCPDETAKDLCLLVMYDLVVLLDDSSTIQYSDGGERMVTLTNVMERICAVYEHARPGGVLSVKFFNEPQGRKNYTVKKVQTLLKDASKWKGVTRIGTALKTKVLDNYVYKDKVLRELTKPLIIIVITDGEVEGEPVGLLENVINEAIKRIAADPKIGKHGMAIQFAHVGNDIGARKLLMRLKSSKELGDNINCLLGEKIENIIEKEKKWDLTANLMMGSIIAQWREMEAPVGLKKEFVLSGLYGEEGALEDLEEYT